GVGQQVPHPPAAGRGEQPQFPVDRPYRRVLVGVVVIALALIRRAQHGLEVGPEEVDQRPRLLAGQPLHLGHPAPATPCSPSASGPASSARSPGWPQPGSCSPRYAPASAGCAASPLPSVAVPRTRPARYPRSAASPPATTARCR